MLITYEINVKTRSYSQPLFHHEVEFWPKGIEFKIKSVLKISILIFQKLP